MKILGITILYYPNEEMAMNIHSYLMAIDKLLIWDNTPGGSNIHFPDNQKIIRRGTNENVGIGKALNEAIVYAGINGFTHLLTMDQDSYFKDDDCRKYMDIVKEAKQKTIFSPNYLIHGKEFYPGQDSFIEVETTMTSGTLYPVSIFDEIGVFRDDFFIDAVDTEFSLRAKQNGIPTKIVPAVYLIHAAGYQKKKHKFLWKTFFPNEYSSVRSYYIVRNGIITRSLYPRANYWDDFLYYWFYKRLFFVLLYENNKYAKCKGLIYGYIHGRAGKTGKQTIFNEKE
jgi:rhamnosyltransferase